MDDADVGLIKDIIEKLGTGSKLVALHPNSDPDALGCAIAICEVFDNVIIGQWDSLSKSAKRLAEHLEVKFDLNPDPGKFDTLVVLDTASPSQVPALLAHLEHAIVIDHHTSSESWPTPYCWVDPDAASCCQMVAMLITKAGLEPTTRAKLALLAGIVTDTAHLRYADNGTFRVVADLTQGEDVAMVDVMSLLEDDVPDPSRRTAHLKGAQRMRFINHGKYIIASTVISAFEASVARKLLVLGADASFVASQNEAKFRVSARMSRGLVMKGIYASTLLTELAGEVSAEAGGHDGAAGMNGTGDAEAILNMCVSKLKQMLDAMGSRSR